MINEIAIEIADWERLAHDFVPPVLMRARLQSLAEVVQTLQNNLSNLKFNLFQNLIWFQKNVRNLFAIANFGKNNQ